MIAVQERVTLSLYHTTGRELLVPDSIGAEHKGRLQRYNTTLRHDLINISIQISFVIYLEFTYVCQMSMCLLNFCTQRS